MGYIINQYAIVEGWEIDHLKAAHKEAYNLFGGLVSPIMEHAINKSATFFVNSSGSNVGWRLAIDHNNNLKKFAHWCRAQNLYNKIVLLDVYEEIEQSKIAETIEYVERDT